MGDVGSQAKVRRRRQTDVQKLSSIVAAQIGHKISVAELLALLQQDDGRWDQAKFERKLAEASADGRIEHISGRTPWVRYVGDERSGGTGGVALYNTVARVLRRHGIPSTRSRDIEVYDTSRHRGVSGQRWVVPDLVAQCHPRAADGSELAPVIHTFEVEKAGAFTIQSVYQAHAQGIGADFSWVIYGRGRVGAGEFLHPDGRRITRVAKELGIGLISFSSGNQLDSWDVAVKPRRRQNSSPERMTFVSVLEIQSRVTGTIAAMRAPGS